MKLCASIFVLAICIIQFSQADWKDDMKREHVNKVDSLINQYVDIVQNAVAQNPSAAGSICAYNANFQLRHLKGTHKSDISSCVIPNNDQSKASSCCYDVDRNVSNKASAIVGAAQTCIFAN